MKPFFFALMLSCALVSPVQASDSALALLDEVVQATAEQHELCINFQQEKQLSYMETPLIATGKLYFKRGPDAERLAWEYLSPTPSGFVLKNGKGFIWTRSRAALRPASGNEAKLLQAIMSQIQTLIAVNPDQLAKTYILRRPTADQLVLQPRHKAFFNEMYITFSPDRRHVEQIRFIEPEGLTLLRFTPCDKASFPDEYQ